MAGRAVIAVLAGLMLSAQIPTPPPSQDTPPIVVIGPDADIVVTGERPMIRGGLWQFTRSATLLLGQGSGIRGFRFTTCLADGALDETLRQLAGERSAMPRGRICGRMRLTIKDARITGGRTCINPSMEIGQAVRNSRMEVSGGYDARRLTVNFRSEDEVRLEGAGRPTGQRWRAEAVRIGDCPAERRRDQRTAEEAVNRLFEPMVMPDAD
jgi:hypothetical protein